MASEIFLRCPTEARLTRDPRPDSRYRRRRTVDGGAVPRNPAWTGDACICGIRPCLAEPLRLLRWTAAVWGPAATLAIDRLVQTRHSVADASTGTPTQTATAAVRRTAAPVRSLRVARAWASKELATRVWGYRAWHHARFRHVAALVLRDSQSPGADQEGFARMVKRCWDGVTESPRSTQPSGSAAGIRLPGDSPINTGRKWA